MIDFIDLFSGIGGFRLGLEKANSVIDAETRGGERVGDTEGRNKPLAQGSGGRTQQSSRSHYRCVWSCDWDYNEKGDKEGYYANQVYTKQFGEENHYTVDIQGVDPEDIPDFDLLCAGFPCQAFSVAGKRKGFQDTRGTLFFEILRVARAKRPSLLLLENVKGLLNHDRGRTFTIILRSLDELGYWVEWQVLNSKYFGVPQNRERVFIVGHLRGTGGREIFPITESGGTTNIRASEEQISSCLQSPGHASGNYRGMTMVIDVFNKGGFKEEEAYALKTNPSPTSSAVIAVLTPERMEKRQHGRRFKEDGEPSFTLTGQDVHGVYIQNLPHGYNTGFKKQLPNLKANKGSQYNELLVKNARIRRLTSVECERLQGFPDGWTEWGIQKPDTIIHDEGTDDEWTEIVTETKVVKISDTQRYKCLGNAVTVNVIEFLGKRILSSFTNIEDTK